MIKLIDKNILLYTIPVYLLVNTYICYERRHFNWRRELLKALFFAYILILAGKLLFPIIIDGLYTQIGFNNIRLNIIPFQQMIKTYELIGLSAVTFYLKHLVLLVPFGLVYPVLFNRNHSNWYQMRCALYIILSIKLFQTLESAYGFTRWHMIDIDEIGLSVLGFVLAFKVSMRLMNNRKVYEWFSYRKYTDAKMERIEVNIK